MYRSIMKFTEIFRPKKDPENKPTREAILASNMAIMKMMVAQAFSTEGDSKELKISINVRTGEIVADEAKKKSTDVMQLDFSVKKIPVRGVLQYDLIFEMHRMMTLHPEAIEALRTLRDNFNK